MPLPEVDRTFRYGSPAAKPALDETWSGWETITLGADPWLHTVRNETLLSYGTRDGKPTDYTLGSLLPRNIYHYWYHTGENAAFRQQLGHTNLPELVGNIDDEAPYRLECGDR